MSKFFIGLIVDFEFVTSVFLTHFNLMDTASFKGMIQIFTIHAAVTDF